MGSRVGKWDAPAVRPPPLPNGRDCNKLTVASSCLDSANDTARAACDGALLLQGTYQDPNTFVQLPLQSAVQREITRYYMSETPSLAGMAEDLVWNVSIKTFAHPAIATTSVLGQLCVADWLHGGGEGTGPAPGAAVNGLHHGGVLAVVGGMGVHHCVLLGQPHRVLWPAAALRPFSEQQLRAAVLPLLPLPSGLVELGHVRVHPHQQATGVSSPRVASAATCCRRCA
eukprot:364699-Chlamydomonas_euryale.AAC.2